MDGIRAFLAGTGGMEPPPLPGWGQRRDTSPRGRRGAAGTEGTAGKAASKAAPGLCLRKAPEGQGIPSSIPGGMPAGTCHRAVPCPTPNAPDPSGGDGTGRGLRPSVPVTFHVPSPTSGILAPVQSCTQVAMAPAGNAARCYRPPSPLTAASPCPPRPGPRPPGPATAPRPGGTPRWAAPGQRCFSPSPRSCSVGSGLPPKVGWCL